jgi:hypothetical protein
VHDIKEQGSELPGDWGGVLQHTQRGQDAPGLGSTSLTALASDSLRDGEASRTVSLSKGSGRDARATSLGFHFYVVHSGRARSMARSLEKLQTP